MADALLSPAVGGAFYAASAGALAVSAKKLAAEGDERKVPLMGVLGAFVFAAQMINFTVPGTGSSGHLVGGILLMILFGPAAAFITLTSVLIVQALFFADGGLLALGANIWNLAFYTAFVGGWIFQGIVRRWPGRGGVSVAAVIGSVVTLELGALSVTVETILSGRTELSFGHFALLMAGIHLPIGLVEGLVTVAVINLVDRLRPELLQSRLGKLTPAAPSYQPLLAAFLVATFLTAGILAWFASTHPDGLEWSIEKVTGSEELESANKGIPAAFARLQEKLSFLPDYDFPPSPAEQNISPLATKEEEGASLVSPGTSLAGIVGSLIVLVAVALIGFALARLRPRRSPSPSS